MTSILEAQTAALSVRHKEKASQETNMRKLSEAYLSCVRAFWLQPAEGSTSASTGSFWKFICWFQCLGWSQSRICWRMLSAGGCVLLWLVPWTAFVAEAHCTCTYRWRGRWGREHKTEEGGVARRSQARTDCVCVHAESSCWALSRSALALSFPFSFPSDWALADTLTSAVGASGLSIKRCDTDDTEQLPGGWKCVNVRIAPGSSLLIWRTHSF